MLTDFQEMPVWVVVKVRDKVGDKIIYGDPIIVEASFDEDKCVRLCMALNLQSESQLTYQVWKCRKV